jgi:transketolase
MSPQDLQQKAINTIRFLSADGVQKANSGHPGLPMGTASIAYTIFTRHLHFDPKDPKWMNRDRFILSGGHGSMLLYSILYLTGYNITLDDLKQFRQWGSITPGHPEAGLTPGVETTTGPLGQGFANGVGMAVAEANLAATYNKPGNDIIDHHTYAIVTDGDLMEGVASEAASLAGHLKLGKLIYLYDDNKITIDGSTDLAFTEDREKRFQAYGWHTIRVNDGNDVDEIDRAIQQAKKDPRPSLILCKTIIGFGLPTRQGTSRAHGEPPGMEELNAAKTNADWPLEPMFFVPDEVLQYFRSIGEKGTALHNDWDKIFSKYQKEFPDAASELLRRFTGKLPDGFDTMFPSFPADAKGMASRSASHKVINAIAPKLPELFGGSADLAPSNNTWMQDIPAFQPETPEGRNFHFGVREHGMGSIVNGITWHGGFRPYGATFLVFTDYMRPAIRVAALSHLPSIWVMTHDSIGLGEDGPTHQPVEQIASLRAIPNLTVIRPCDANEVTEAWKAALQRTDGPTLLALSRQNLPTIDRSRLAPASGLHKGAYVMCDMGGGKAQIILMATGSEVALALEAASRLTAKGLNVRVVSFPSWELFEKQDQAYQNSVFPPSIEMRISIEAGVTQGWNKWVGTKGKIIGLDRFGASAPASVLFKQFGFTVDAIVKSAEELTGIIEDEII